MKRFNWEFDFDPYFPAHFFEYTVVGRKDAMHWHRYVEIGLCLEGEGQFLYSYKLKFAFTTDAGILEYLNGRIFIAPEVWFKSEFLSGKLTKM